MRVKKITEVEFMSKESVFIDGVQYIRYDTFKKLENIYGDITKDLQEEVTALKKENRILKDYTEYVQGGAK